MKPKPATPASSEPRPAGVPLSKSRHPHLRRLVPALLALLIILGLALPSALPAVALQSLTITPLTWNTVGLNSADVNVGPNIFQVGARVCAGDTAVSNVVAALVWDSENTYIQSLGPSSLSMSSIAQNSCQDFYFNIRVTRDAAAFETVRRYHITAQAEGVEAVSTPSPREIYVERLAPRANLTTTSIAGPSQVEVGRTYEYVVSSTTGTEEYNQLVHSLSFSSDIFRLQSAAAAYITSEQENDGIYADACRWQDDPSIPATYRTCAVANPVYPGGVISGTLVTTYTVQVLAAGTASLHPLLFGFTGEDYFYAGDFGEDALSVTAAQPGIPTATATMTPIAYLPDIMRMWGNTTPYTPTVTLSPTADLSASPTVSPSITPTPTHTGTTTPQIVVGKTAPVQVQGTINTSFIFTVRVTNTGTHPASTITVNDNVATYPYLEITAVTTDRGTATRNSSTSITVNIPLLNPGEVATITITGRIRSNVTGTPQACNLASLTFVGGAIQTPQPRNSNNACFRVIGGSVLPGTGELPLQEPAAPGTNWLLLIFSLLLGAAGLFALLVSIRAGARQERKAVPAAGFALVLFGGTVLAYLFSSGSFQTTSISSQEPDPQLMVEVEVSMGTLEPAQEASATLNPLAVAPSYLFSTPEPHPLKTLPVFPIPSPTLQSTPGPGENEPDTSPITRVSIPNIELLQAKVAYVPFDGQTWLIEGLREEIAWMGDTSWPGLGGNTGLAAHVTVRGLGNGPFRYLSDLSLGDVVTLYTEKNVYTYAVRDKKVVSETDMSVLEQTSDPRLTLITCINWNEEWEAYIDRLIVTADLVKVEPLGVSSLAP